MILYNNNYPLLVPNDIKYYTLLLLFMYGIMGCIVLVEHYEELALCHALLATYVPCLYIIMVYHFMLFSSVSLCNLYTLQNPISIIVCMHILCINQSLDILTVILLSVCIL